jgi:membrane associated rhomboid family serine protease
MARFRNNPVTISFPSFSGITRQLVIANVAVFFILLLMRRAASQAALLAFSSLALTPALLIRGEVWQLLTYSFLHTEVLHVALNMLSLWFLGWYIESAKGSRWFLQLYLIGAGGGALIGSALSFTGLLHSSPASITAGSDSAIFAVLVAFGVFFGDLEMYMFPLPVSVKARYLVIVYMVLDLAFLLAGGPALSYFVTLGGALAGFVYAKRYGKGAPRKKAAAFSIPSMDLRNRYYRWKRRRAARKFEVYMRKQNREVRFDSEGRYIDPDKDRDPKDRNWMN